MLFLMGSGFASELHVCLPLEYTLNEDSSALVVCSSEQEFIIPAHVNSPDVLRKVIKANKDKSFSLFFKTSKNQNTVRKIEMKKTADYLKQ
ncbi:MAG TPA: hypothetical protein PKC21_04845 [Oligoflexia bacterium]|mgnify:CR=1 FL=1|nr:hypothetical protein [Oligoflexia bacterium]